MKKEQLLKTSITYGIIIFVALVAYFFLMKMLGLIRHQELRAFNGVIILVGVILAIAKSKHINNDRISYFNGIGCGMLTSLFGVAPFAIFVVFYLLIDVPFLQDIQEKSAFGELINPFTGGFINFIEGMAAGLISSFIVMPYFKTSTLEQMKAAKQYRRKANEVRGFSH